jgi:hypothetical protein
MDTIRPFTVPETATARELAACYSYLLKSTPRWFDGMSASDLRAAMPDPVATARAAFDAIEAKARAELAAILEPPRRKRVKVARTPAWIQTTRKPEKPRRSALLVYQNHRWSYSSRGTKGAA